MYLMIVQMNIINERQCQLTNIIMNMDQDMLNEKLQLIKKLVCLFIDLCCERVCYFIYIYLEGEIIPSDEDIIAENVPIITPNGDIIVNSLSLKVRFRKILIFVFFLKNKFHSDYTSHACSHHWTEWLW